ncbi:MAG: hypothetical protein ACI82F_002998 [Planctomycetota bacterium]|jgi:hypothetical protein
MRWLHRDGRELFFVTSLNWAEDLSGHLKGTTQEVAFKLEYSMRF